MCSLKPHQQHVLGCGHRLRFMFFVFNGPSSAHMVGVPSAGHHNSTLLLPGHSLTLPFSSSLGLWKKPQATRIEEGKPQETDVRSI